MQRKGPSRGPFPVGGPDPRFPDPGDKLDVAADPRRAWDFPEDDLTRYLVNGRAHLAYSRRGAEVLGRLQDLVAALCRNIAADHRTWSGSPFFAKRVPVFLDIHAFTRNFSLNEIPQGTGFDGMNKPRDRYVTRDCPGIGADGKIRASRRDIFLNLDKSPRQLQLLLVHELAHTLANHVTFREDDHHADFELCEKFLKMYWPV